MVDLAGVTRDFGSTRLASPRELAALGLGKGQISPFMNGSWPEEPLHLVCPSVMENRRVHTNNGQVGGWISFRPQDILFFLDRVIVSPISRTKP